MATDNQSLQDEAVDNPDESESVAVFQWWKFLMVIFAGIGAFLNGSLNTRAVGYAVGYATGQMIMIAIVIGIVTGISRKYNWLQVDSVRSNVYAGVCIISALLGAFGGLLGLHIPVFVMAYVTFLITAIVGETLFGASKSPSTAN